MPCQLVLMVIALRVGWKRWCDGSGTNGQLQQSASNSLGELARSSRLLVGLAAGQQTPPISTDAASNVTVHSL